MNLTGSAPQVLRNRIPVMTVAAVAVRWLPMRAAEWRDEAGGRQEAGVWPSPRGSTSLTDPCLSSRSSAESRGRPGVPGSCQLRAAMRTGGTHLEEPGLSELLDKAP